MFSWASRVGSAWRVILRDICIDDSLGFFDFKPLVLVSLNTGSIPTYVLIVGSLWRETLRGLCNSGPFSVLGPIIVSVLCNVPCLSFSEVPVPTIVLIVGSLLRDVLRGF